MITECDNLDTEWTFITLEELQLTLSVPFIDTQDIIGNTPSCIISTCHASSFYFKPPNRALSGLFQTKAIILEFKQICTFEKRGFCGLFEL
ncbi:MAG: hypothetical protein COW02_03535 [Comamonadaceae bacterium CG12_big_fil_rev_8_21_14_0_65_59_15]|nr:MAG: hypothetical protein COW02_03535 [Comamonadaceae bacterium CG12_big_fil_rev_8_21_14_0_65_59_15]